jgi:hypothetical protein
MYTDPLPHQRLLFQVCGALATARQLNGLDPPVKRTCQTDRGTQKIYVFYINDNISYSVSSNHGES